jgi:phosphoribosyl-ATP pyrophosphohydrolase
MNQNEIFEKLFEIIRQRKESSPDESYVARLMHTGVAKINSKIIEEAGEVCVAAQQNDKEHLIYEICDLLFHSFVLAGYKDISLNDLQAELTRRFGTSGLEEKASRNSADS